MKLWDSGAPKSTQILLLVVSAILLFLLFTQNLVYPRIDWPKAGETKAKFAVSLEKELEEITGDVLSEVKPDYDWEGMNVSIKFFVWNEEAKERMLNSPFWSMVQDNGPIIPFIKAFALAGPRYSRNLCQKAEEEFPDALIFHINVHYYTTTTDADGSNLKETLHFSETSDCEVLPKIPIWKYLISYF